MKISLNELLDVLSGDSERFDYIKENTLRIKQSDVLTQVIVKDKSVGKFYGADYWRNYNNGIEEDSFALYPVEQIMTVSYKVVDE